MFTDEIQLNALKEGRADSCEIDLTGRCHAGCNYCYAQSTSNTSKELSTRILNQIIDDLKEIGVSYILWEGGEPLLRKDWKDIINYSKNLGFHNRILTSGYQLNDINFASNVLDTVDTLEIHLDTLDEKRYMDVRTTQPDYYKKVLKGLYNIIELDGKEKLALKLCILKNNTETMVKTIDWAVDELGLPGSAIFIGPYTPFPGQSKDKIDFFTPPITEVKKIMGYYYHKVGLISKEDKKNGNYPFLCNENKIYCATTFIINYLGEVKACAFFNKCYGNVNNQRLIDIYNKNRIQLLKLDLRENVKGKCKDCFYGEICHGCRANAIGYVNDILQEDPLCWLVSDKIKKISEFI
jgi:radical SAM protein with 4Fe4S-binding SPASM domain